MITDALSRGPEENGGSNQTTEARRTEKGLRFPRQRGKQEKIYRNAIGNSGGAAQTELHLGLFLVTDAVDNITLSLFVL